MLNQKKKYTFDELFKIISEAIITANEELLNDLEESLKEDGGIPSDMKADLIIRNYGFGSYLKKILFIEEGKK